MKRILDILILIVCAKEAYSGSSSISLGPPSVYKQPQNHTVNVGDNVQFYCKIRANPLAHVALKFNPENSPITVRFPMYGGYPTGGNTIVLLDLMKVQYKDEGRYTCFGENKYGTVESHGWLKFVKECNCNMAGVAYPEKPCDDDGQCRCRERVGGKACDRCMEGFYNFPECYPCECNPWGTVGQSLSCDQDTGECNCLPDRAYFDPIKCDGCPPEQYFNPFTQRCQPCSCYPDGSVSRNCDYTTGKCECKDKFTGNKCGSCKDGYYNRNEGCEPCDCVVENTLGFDYRCDSRTGQCNCRSGKVYTDPRTCASCPKDTYYDEFTQQCEDCGCNPYGTDRCNPKGECVCKENFTGIKCDECEENYYGADMGYCEPCNCNPYGTINGQTQCDRQGNCPCKNGHSNYNWKQCDGCPPGKTINYNNPLECDDCNCNPKGSVNQECDLYTGQCDCKPNTYGEKCDNCQPGFYGLSTQGECLPCNCDPFNSFSLQCDTDSGQCPCRPNILFTDKRTCSGCPLGQYSKVPGTCDPCNCNTNGSISIQCDSVGQCACQPTVQALKCDECKPGYYNFRQGGCDPCNCNPYGVVDGNTICDPVTGQCDCKEGQTKLSPRTCDGCPPGYYVNVDNPLQCFSCDCHPYGAVDPNCDLYTGTCDCGPNVKGDKCDECEEGFYGLNIVGIQKCVPCECDPEGSTSQFCDMFGQCQCKPGYGTIDPRTCLGCPRGMYYQDGFCIPCGCDRRGSLTDECDKEGNCYCADYVYSFSPKCDTCETNYWFGDPNQVGCEPCQCDTTGTINQSEECDTNSGQCDCLDDDPFLFFLDPRRCEPCDKNQYNLNGECTDCGCHVGGSTGLQCDFLTGQCPCTDGAFGFSCDECKEGYYDLDQGCQPCHCDTRNTINNDPNCDLFGNCQCKENFIYTDVAKCSTCGEGYYEDEGTCSPCDCHLSGSVNSTCDTVTGQCPCLEGVTGRRCNECEGDSYGINSGDGCKPCNCNTNGTVSRSSACDEVTGQCDCMDGRTRYEPRTCDGCLNNFLVNEYLDPVTRECVPCNCLEVGSRQFNCSTYEGTCDCNPGVIGEKCDTRSCRLGPWSEWSDCQERESRCVRLRSQEKLEPSSGDHDLIPYKEDCSQPAIEVEDCSPSECENLSKRLRRVFWY